MSKNLHISCKNNETASDELVPSLQFVQKLAQVSSVYHLKSVLICQKSPPSGHIEKKCQSKSRPMGPPDSSNPHPLSDPPPLGVNIDRCIMRYSSLDLPWSFIIKTRFMSKKFKQTLWLLL